MILELWVSNFTYSLIGMAAITVILSSVLVLNKYFKKVDRIEEEVFNQRNEELYKVNLRYDVYAVSPKHAKQKVRDKGLNYALKNREYDAESRVKQISPSKSLSSTLYSLNSEEDENEED